MESAYDANVSHCKLVVVFKKIGCFRRLTRVIVSPHGDEMDYITKKMAKVST
jgi:hypothetical protein